MKRIILCLCFAAIAVTGAANAQQKPARYFAEVRNGVVLRVIVIDPAELPKGHWGESGNFIETFLDGSARRNYAGPGFSFDVRVDRFAKPKPFPSWSFDESAADWKAPTQPPRDGRSYYWNEPTQSWRSL